MKMFKILTSLLVGTALFAVQAQVKDLPDFLVVWRAYLASPDRTAVEDVLAVYDALLPYKQRVANERMRTDLGINIRELRAIQTARRTPEAINEETRRALEQAQKDIAAREEEIRRSRESEQQKQEEIRRLEAELEALKKLQEQMPPVPPTPTPTPVPVIIQTEGVISQELVVRDAAEFSQKVSSIIAQANKILRAGVNDTTTRNAADAYKRLETLLDVYQDRYPLPSPLKQDAMNALESLASKFALPTKQGVTPVPVLVPTEGIISKELVVRNANEFSQKISSIIAQIKTLMAGSVSDTNKRNAADAYKRLETLLNVYQNRYPLPPQLKQNATDSLESLAAKFAFQLEPLPITPLPPVKPPVVIPPVDAKAMLEAALSNLRDIKRPNRAALGDAVLVAVDAYKPQSTGTSDGMVQKMQVIFEETRKDKDDKSIPYENRKSLNVNVIYLLSALDRLGVNVDDTAGKDVCALWRKPTYGGILPSEIDAVCQKYGL